MDILLLSITSFLATVAAIPATIKLANKFGLVDNPRVRLHPAHIHTGVIPRAGGLPIYLGIVLPALLFLTPDKHLLGIFLGITILLAIGLIDDKLQKFNPYLRLGLLFLAAAAVVGSGIGISFISNPLLLLPNLPDFLTGPVIRLDQPLLSFDLLGPHKIIVLADLLALFWIVALTQVINWSKGVDGQMPGITTVAALTLGLLSLKLYSQGDPNQLGVAKLAFLTGGASLGFLVFNWHPSRIFPGFSGSTILAFMLATLSILSGAKLATALLVLAIPAADFARVFWRRIFSGHSPVWPDRGHLHHRLLDLGWSPEHISLFYILGSAMFGAIALMSNTEVKVATAAATVVAFSGLILWINSLGD